MTVRVVNRRHCFDTSPDKAVHIGRGESVLGNPFVLKRESDRPACIEQYRVWLRAEYEKHDKVYRELLRLAGLVCDGHNLALVCWCAPKMCHGGVLAEAIGEINGIR